MLRDFFKPRLRLEAEILILRHQLNVLQQRAPRRRLHLRWIDRALFIWLYRRYPRILDALSIVRPETVVRWHRKGFTGYWRWKSRSPGGRPRIAREVRELIRRMSFENSLWGATKIHGELLKLGIAVAQSTVSVYMVPRRDRPLQTWKTFADAPFAWQGRTPAAARSSGSETLLRSQSLADYTIDMHKSEISEENCSPRSFKKPPARSSPALA